MEKTSLVLNVKSDTVTQAAKNLRKLEESAVKTEKATDVLGKTNKKLTTSSKKLAEQTKKTEKAQSGLSRVMQSSKAATLAIAGAMKKATVAIAGGMYKATVAVTGVLKKAIPVVAAVGVAFIALKSAAAIAGPLLKAAANAETLRTSFVSLTGSVTEARQQVAILTDFTARTSFQLEGVAKAGRQLITARGSTKGLTEDLRILGDIASTANVPIDELAQIYTKAFNKGKIQAEELNQISERGIPIIRQLAEQYGVSKNEVFKLGEQGKLSFADLEEAFQNFTSEGGFAFNAMIRQSGTLNGKMSTLRDNVKLSSATIGNRLAEAFNVSGILDGLTEIAQKVDDLFKTEAERNSELVDINEIYKKRLDLQKQINEQSKRSRRALGRSRITSNNIVKNLSKELSLLDERYNKFSEGERQILDFQKQINAAKREEQRIEEQLLEKIEVKRNGRARGRARIQFVTQTREATAAEQARLDVLRQQQVEYAKQVQTLKQLEIEANAPKIAVDGALAKQFAAIEKSLDTGTEAIERQFEQSMKVVQNYYNNLSEAGALTIDEGKAINGTIAKLAIERKKALDDLNESNVAQQVADTFLRVEDSLRTQSEIIQDQFADRTEAIREYKKSLSDVGDLTVEETEKINAALARAESAKFSALSNLGPPDLLKRPEEKKPTVSRSSSRRSSGSSQKSEFEKLKESLKDQNKLVEESYLRRLEIIRRNTVEGSEARTELEKQLKIQATEEINREVQQVEYSALESSYETGLEQLQSYYDQRKQLVLDSTVLTEQEKNEKIAEFEAQRLKIVENIEKERWARTIAGTQTALGEIASIQSAFGKRGAKIAKAAAIANATIDTARNAILGYQRGLEIPVVGPVLAPIFAATAIAAGAAQIAQIKSQDVGNYATGGIIPGNSFSGDNLQANVNSSEMILNRQQQAQLFAMANGQAAGGQGGGNLNITVIPTEGTTAEVSQDPNNPQNIEILLRKMDEKLTSDLQTNDGEFIPALTTKIPALRQA